MGNSLKGLRVCSKIYYIIGILYAVLCAAVAFLAGSSELQEELRKSVGNLTISGVNSVIVLTIIVGIEALLFIVLGILSSKVAHKVSVDTVLMVLLILELVRSVYSVITSFNVVGLAILLLHGAALYYVIQIRKEK